MVEGIVVGQRVFVCEIMSHICLIHFIRFKDILVQNAFLLMAKRCNFLKVWST